MMVVGGTLVNFLQKAVNERVWARLWLALVLVAVYLALG